MVQWNLYKAETIDAKRSVCFVEMSALYRFLIFFKIVWPQSKAIRSLLYSPPCRGVCFIECPLYRDSTVILLNFLMTRLLGKTTDLKKPLQAKDWILQKSFFSKGNISKLNESWKAQLKQDFLKIKNNKFFNNVRKKGEKEIAIW